MKTFRLIGTTGDPSDSRHGPVAPGTPSWNKRDWPQRSTRRGLVSSDGGAGIITSVLSGSPARNLSSRPLSFEPRGRLGSLCLG
jgi:hypothetical protein